MNDIEILLNAFIHVGLSISIFLHIEAKDYKTKCKKFLFVVPMWSMFVGFYYLNLYIFETELLGHYWRTFRVFEVIGNACFWSLIIFKNYKIKIKNEENN